VQYTVLQCSAPPCCTLYTRTPRLQRRPPSRLDLFHEPCSQGLSVQLPTYGHLCANDMHHATCNMQHAIDNMHLHTTFSKKQTRKSAPEPCPALQGRAQLCRCGRGMPQSQCIFSAACAHRAHLQDRRTRQHRDLDAVKGHCPAVRAEDICMKKAFLLRELAQSPCTRAHLRGPLGWLPEHQLGAPQRRCPGQSTACLGTSEQRARRWRAAPWPCWASPCWVRPCSESQG
jgi:hypothetical protein